MQKVGLVSFVWFPTPSPQPPMKWLIEYLLNQVVGDSCGPRSFILARPLLEIKLVSGHIRGFEAITRIV